MGIRWTYEEIKHFFMDSYNVITWSPGKLEECVPI